MQPPSDLPERPAIKDYAGDFGSWTEAMKVWNSDPRVVAWLAEQKRAEEARINEVRPRLECDACEVHRVEDPRNPWVIVHCGPHRVDALMGQLIGFSFVGNAVDRYMPVPARYASADPSHLIPALRTWNGTHGLYLAGPVGTGKTYQAAALVRMRFRTFDPPHLNSNGYGDPVINGGRRPVVWCNVPKLLEDVRRSFDAPDNAPKGLEYAPLLVLDDIGAEKPSEWVEERLYCIVNERYENNRPLIVTSNLTPAQLGGQVGARLASRLREMCEIHGLGGRDRRLKAAS